MTIDGRWSCSSAPSQPRRHPPLSPSRALGGHTHRRGVRPLTVRTAAPAYRRGEVQPSEGAAMRLGYALVPLLVALAAPAIAGGGRGAKKPRLDLRASPRLAVMPVDVLVVAELVGGDEIEDFYC